MIGVLGRMPSIWVEVGIGCSKGRLRSKAVSFFVAPGSGIAPLQNLGMCNQMLYYPELSDAPTGIRGGICLHLRFLDKELSAGRQPGLVSPIVLFCIKD